ncbi:Nucleolar MIF4G domain containing protein 1 [Dissostichus eleginoides]|uniref:Nucleolar MIF4G domain containing protein 1 n=1 Tax=Dissostichus eleginoides TaxID=100907 RepID=A0AAD9EXW0_DISEL|nr:Nucleolar MIF4G domain containing protein 1 [Dissostichus eleginoides]
MKGKWKQNTNKKKGNEVLEKCLVAVDEFIKKNAGEEDGANDHGLRFVKKKSRKDLRKETRKFKKAKMKNYYEGNKTLIEPPNEELEKHTKKKRLKKKKKPKVNNEEVSTSEATEQPNKSKKPSKKVNKLQESRKIALLEANEQEDREIKKLEKCLGLNKRKNKKSLPQSFVTDGLDYILGILDSGSNAEGILSEPNMAWISGQLEELYMSSSRKDMTDMLTEVLLSACVSSALMPDRLLMEHVLLISILHHAVGLEVGAHFLETVVRQFDEVYKNPSETKECDNLISIICHLYNFQVVHSVLVFDILKHLVGDFREKDIELVLLC